MANFKRTFCSFTKIIIWVLLLQYASLNDEAYSFSERFLEIRAGRFINLTRLTEEYSKICPLTYSCDVRLNNTLFLRNHADTFPECPECNCKPTCVRFGNCCPGVHFGYVNYKCRNVAKYPDNLQAEKYLASGCPGDFSNTTTAEKCETEFLPCTATHSNLTYENRFCAECNREAACIDWKLNVNCGNYIGFIRDRASAKSLIDVKLALDKNVCQIIFELPDGTSSNLAQTCAYKDYNTNILIHACNITGLWKDFDPDINWACQNFIVPYKEFKNVYCYICNPSRASEQHSKRSNDPVVFKKNNSNKRNREMRNICTACKKISQSKRLGLRRNAYCLKCNNIQQLSILAEGSVQIDHISESVDSNLFSVISFKMSFTNESNIIKEFSQIVDIHFKQVFDVEHKNGWSSEYKKPQLSSVDLEKIDKDYESVCGNGNSCSELFNATRELNYKYRNPVCGSCSCDNQCVDTFNCCPNLIFRIMPYSCVKGVHCFALVKSSEEVKSVSEQEIVGIDKSYTVIDKCMHISDNVDLSTNCSDSDPNSDILHQIPVSSDANVTYKNIFCYLCNKKLSGNYSGLRLSFQVSCSSYIEHELYISMEDLLRDIRLYCNRVTFIPQNNLECANKYYETDAKYAGGIKYVQNKFMSSNTSREITKRVTVILHYPNEYYNKTHTKKVYARCNQTGNWFEKDDFLQEICEGSLSHTLNLHEYRPNNNVYKNFACFICNPEKNTLYFNENETVGECSQNIRTELFYSYEELKNLCSAIELNRRWLPYKNLYCSECNQPPWQRVNIKLIPVIVMDQVPLIYIFSMSVEDFEHLDNIKTTEMIPECEGGTYDRTLKQCRNLYCKDGYELLNSTCSPILKSASNQVYEISVSLKPASPNYTHDLKVNMYSPRMVSLPNLCRSILNHILVEFSDDTVNSILEEECVSSAPCLEFSNNTASGNLSTEMNDSLVELSQGTGHSTLKEGCTSSSPCLNFISNTAPGKLIDLARTEKVTARFKMLIEFSDNIISVETALGNALNRKFYVTVNNGHMPFKELLTSSPFHDKEQAQLKLCISAFSNNRVHATLSQNKRQTKVDRFLSCAYVKLDTSNISLNLFSNDITLKYTNVTFTADEYQIEGNFVKVCANDFEKRTYQPALVKMVPYTPDDKKALIIFSLVCAILSLICLFLTFVTYCLLPTLRTVPGKNIMVLCAYLFFSQAFLHFGLNQVNQTTACIVIGACIHLFTLGSFCVMNVCSFHIFFTFCHNQLSVHHLKHHTFARYLTYEVLLPLLFVAITMFVSLLRSKGVDFGYGKFYCFISDFYLFLGTFLAPVCLTIISNIVFFSLAFHQIRNSPMVSGKQQRNNFFICLKLLALIGITWPLLIVDNVINITWFSFIASGLNSLQGVFILFSFVINKNVAAMIRSGLVTKFGGKESLTKTSRIKKSSKTKNDGDKFEEEVTV